MIGRYPEWCVCWLVGCAVSTLLEPIFLVCSISLFGRRPDEIRGLHLRSISFFKITYFRRVTRPRPSIHHTTNPTMGGSRHPLGPLGGRCGTIWVHLMGICGLFGRQSAAPSARSTRAVQVGNETLLHPTSGCRRSSQTRCVGR